MAWKIDRDYMDGATSESAVGTASCGPDLAGPTFGFRLLDDDGEVYYHGVADEAAVVEDDEVGGLYEAYRWGGYFAGAVDLQVRARDGWNCGLVDKRLHPDPAEWVSVYG